MLHIAIELLREQPCTNTDTWICTVYDNTVKLTLEFILVYFDILNRIHLYLLILWII